MGIFQRIADIIKGSVKAAEDRVERVALEEETRLAKARKDALAELDAAGARALRTNPPEFAPASPHISPDLLADYRTLGLTHGAELDQVEAAWRELVRRADPKRFASGSEEERKAAEILKRINASYTRIREHLNPTEGRFGRLEL